MKKWGSWSCYFPSHWKCTAYPIHSSPYNCLASDSSSPLETPLTEITNDHPGEIFQWLTQWLTVLHSCLMTTPSFIMSRASLFQDCLPLWPIFTHTHTPICLYFFFLNAGPKMRGFFRSTSTRFLNYILSLNVSPTSWSQLPLKC